MKLNTSMLMVITATTLIAGETQVVFEENFTPGSAVRGWNRRGTAEIVAVDDCSEVTSALKLTNPATLERPGYGYSTAVEWLYGSGLVTIDYRMKAMEGANRGIFVSDADNKHIIRLSLQYGRICYNNSTSYLRTHPLEYGKWYHIRYVINPVSRSYDIYIDDMNDPHASGLKFFDSEAGLPEKLRIHACEAANAQLFLAKIRVTQKKTRFPATELSLSPFFLGAAYKVGSSPITDGGGGSPLWQQAAPVELIRFDAQPVIEKSRFRALYDDTNLYLLVESEAPGHHGRPVVAKNPEQRPWIDDSVEIFLDPRHTRHDYFQLVANTIGTKYSMHNTREKYRDTTVKVDWRVKIKPENDRWSMEISIPFADCGGFPGAGEIWGLNVCRNNPGARETTQWSPTDMHHRPEIFGNLVFLTSEFLAQSHDVYERTVAEKLHPLEPLLKSTRKILADLLRVSSTSKTRTLQEQFKDIEQDATTVRGFLDHYSLYSRLAALATEIKSTAVAEERMARLFAPGTPAAKRSYTVFPESPLVRVDKQEYSGNITSEIVMELAGREYGSFQLVIVSDGQNPLGNIELKLSGLKHGNGKVLAGKDIKQEFYRVEYIRTALPGKTQRMIPDVLRPGNNFVVPDSGTVFPFFCELQIPAGTEPGIYSATVRITPDGLPPMEVPLRVTVLPFDLPLENTLGTLFSFAPRWAEMYYDAKMPEEARSGYFDLMIEHRLDPVNLWPADKRTLLTEEEMKKYIDRGMRNIHFCLNATEKEVREDIPVYLDILERNGWVDKAILFGFDECLHNPARLPQMQKMFALVKELTPELKRMCTMEVDPRGIGYVDIWCPYFSNYRPVAARDRVAEGEKVWWYSTDYPLAPWPSLNLDQNPMGPRMMVWITWKKDIPGILYWATNREWITNNGRCLDMSENDIVSRDLGWLKDKGITREQRWPEIPWVPAFISLNPRLNQVSGSNGGGNLIYPGPNWQPLPSIRLKNLRDGLQDHAALTLLKNTADKLRIADDTLELRKEIDAVLAIDPAVVKSSIEFTKDPAELLSYRSRINQLLARGLSISKNLTK